ncbi:MAG: hypothetical protein IKR25_04995 [Muribaculaceae bacterium]|nr:hypothetical protein [Muribaculaceae bacterium]
MDSERKNQIAASVITLIILLLTLGLMVSCGLHYEWPPDEPTQVELKQDSILFGGEYVMLGNTPEPAESEQMDEPQPDTAEKMEPEPNVAGDDLEDAGEPAKQAPEPVTAKEPSPMKVKEKPKEEKPKKTGPAVETPKPTEKQPKVKRAEESTPKPTEKQPNTKRSDNATPKTDRVKDAFGKSSGKGSGKQGSPDGNSDKGAVSGKPSIGGLEGYTLAHWETTHSQHYGSVVVKVNVAPNGQVKAAHAVSGSGAAWSDVALRRRCEAAALRCRFSVPKGRTTEGIGTITYSLKP